MNLVQKDLWEVKADLHAVTCNGHITKDRHLVMGRGAALEAASHWPELPDLAADTILENDRVRPIHLKYFGNEKIFIYGWVVVKGRLGLFQVKYHYREHAQLSLTGYSIVLLNKWVRETRSTVAMNYPGIGYGHLTMEQVKPLLMELDDRVTLCYREDKLR